MTPEEMQENINQLAERAKTAVLPEDLELTGDELIAYLSMCATVALSGLQGAAGPQFVTDYLATAMADTDMPALKRNVH